MKKFGFVLAGAAAFALTASTASAALFFSDGFDYPDGQLTASGGGADVSGGLWTGHSGTTFGDNVQVVGGEAIVKASGSEDVNRLTGATLGAGQKIFAAFQFKARDDRANPSVDAINNDYFAHFKDSGFGFRSRIYMDDPNVADPTKFTLGLSGTSGGQTQKWAADLAFGTSHIVVMSYDFDTGAAEMWVDPTSMASTSLVESVTVSAGTAINAFALRQDFIGGTPNNAVLVNIVTVGDTFADVFNAVPEPASLSLLAIGGLAVLRRRR